MSKKRPPKKTPAPSTALTTTTSPPRFQCANLGNSFKLGAKFCQLLKPLAPNELEINTVTLIIRGRASGADMDDEAAGHFRTHRWSIPSEQKGTRIIFPESKTGDDCIRCLEFAAETDSWCMVLRPIQETWNSAVALAQLTDDVAVLLEETTIGP